MLISGGGVERVVERRGVTVCGGDNEWQSTVVLDLVFRPSRPAGAALTFD